MKNSMDESDERRKEVIAGIKLKADDDYVGRRNQTVALTFH